MVFGVTVEAGTTAVMLPQPNPSESWLCHTGMSCLGGTVVCSRDDPVNVDYLLYAVVGR